MTVTESLCADGRERHYFGMEGVCVYCGHDSRFDVTVILGCGDSFGLNLLEGVSGPRVGDYYSCSTHSAADGYDPATGDPEYERDQRVAEVRRG